MPPARPLRIAVVALHTSPTDAPGAGDVGGMNVAVRATVEQMAELGHRVDVLTRRYSPELPIRFELSERITLHFVDAGPPEPRPKGDHELYIEEFAAGMAVLGAVDIVHSHHWFSGMAALPFARTRGVPHVQSYHSIAAPVTSALSEGERPESPGRIAGERWLAQNSDAIVAVSEAEAATITGRLGSPPGNVTVVLPGVDTELFHPGATQRPDRYVLTAARIEPLKGLDLAVRTIAALPAALRPDLVVAGGPTVGYEGYLAELRSLAFELGIPDGVRFVGPLSRVELAELMRHASALLIPSHSETFGLVALEAAASGIPVLATPAGGLRESVTNQTGILLNSRGPEVWANALAALLTDADRAARLSASARAFALTRTWRRDAEQTLDVYRAAIERLGGLRGRPEPRP
ncbi:glycosyltransferase [Rathayibacter soli]|uniref:glycosyltransferase n=1 Tax=Rathayibacter soli TaxID=3144168 RepID=UPI0027E59CC9|nr:glycosyltransferase [Glaciibacter superstes]